MDTPFRTPNEILKLEHYFNNDELEVEQVSGGGGQGRRVEILKLWLRARWQKEKVVGRVPGQVKGKNLGGN